MRSLFERLVGVADGVEELGVSLVVQPPGIATPLHAHANEVEAAFLLEGTMRYRLGDDVHDLDAGSFVFLPRGVPHAFRVTGTQPARWLGMASPGRLLHLYDEVGLPATENRLPGDGDGRTFEDEVARWMRFGPDFGLEVLGPPIPDGG
jgi:quercetin dioxygenase-like cupin family protein